MTNLYIYLAVIVCGASVLAIEILGTRVIAPFYGVSLYTWSGLISVTLAALSVGYALGGRWADKGPKLSRFCLVIAAAGLWIILIPWLRTPVLHAAEPLGLRAAVLVAATVLFFFPLALLGMVGPYAIRLMAKSLEVVGRTAGNLYAVSTMASVAAAVVTGFFLIPNIGLYPLIFSIGVVLIATAMIGLTLSSKNKTARVSALTLAVISILGLLVAPSQTADPENGLVAIEQSPYAEIRVVDLAGERLMLIDGGIHTVIDTVDGISRFPYVDVLDISKVFYEVPGNMLLIGLGGGSVVKNFARDGWSVDAVEIDATVTRVAYEYFGLKENEAEVYEMDGRQYLITNDKKYDLIVMDAFGSSAIPFHLVTDEAFGLIREHLKTDGILAMNVESVGWRDQIVLSLSATANRQFANVLVLPMAEPPDQLGNVILLASNRSLELKVEPPVPFDRFSAEYNRAHAWDNRFVVDTAGIQALTDELNPVDIWAERVNLAARKDIHAKFAQTGIGW